MLAEEHEAQGNYAAAEAIRLQDPINEVYRWYEEVELTSVGIEAIRVLQERIDSEPDAAKRRQLKFFLAWEHQQEEDYAASEAIYLQLFETKPEDPVPLIKLAEQKLYFEKQPEPQCASSTGPSGPLTARAISVGTRSASKQELRWR